MPKVYPLEEKELEEIEHFQLFFTGINGQIQ
jgi:hypothetical protein